MQRNFVFKLTKKERELRGFVKLVKENGAVLSSYCSFAFRAFFEQNRFLKIATVVPDAGDDAVFINLYLDEELSGMLSDYMEKHRIKTRSKLVKMILTMSLQAGTEGVLVPEFDLQQALYSAEVSVPLVRKETIRRQEEDIPVAVKKQPKEKRERVESKAPIQEESFDGMPEPEEEESNGEHDLLDNLFAGLDAQMNKW